MKKNYSQAALDTLPGRIKFDLYVQQYTTHTSIATLLTQHVCGLRLHTLTITYNSKMGIGIFSF